jgi:hypothetical protein
MLFSALAPMASASSGAPIVLVFDEPQAGVSTHALVVGIGVYPHCGPNATVPEFRAVLDLTSPQVSAHTFARYLINQADTLDAPLASVRLLTDPVDGSAFDAPTPPTFANIEAAIPAWQAAAGNGDCLILYWCGHGFENSDGRHLLVCSDAGENGYFWKRTLDSTGDFLRAPRSPARTQLWLIDACREDADDVGLVDAQGETTLPDLGNGAFANLSNKDLAAIVSSSAFSTATGDTDEPSDFCKALIQALDWRAFERVGDRWMIRTFDLLTPINEYFEERDLKQRAHPRDGIGSHVVWSTANAPGIPAQFQCDPLTVRQRVLLELLSIDEQTLQPTLVDRQPNPSLRPWRREVPAGFFRLLGRMEGSEPQYKNVTVMPRNRVGVLPWQR